MIKTKNNMKKLFFILSMLTVLSISAQNKFVNATIDSSGNVVANYIDNLGNLKTKNFPALNEEIKSLVQDSLNDLPMAMAKVMWVSYVNDEFSISGELRPLVLMKYSNLSAPRKAIVDALKAKIFEVKGVNMTTLSTKFGSNLVTINGVEYPYADFISTAFGNAITLANELYNDL
jgi:hypothetical protein